MKMINMNAVQAQEEGKAFKRLPVGAYNCMIMSVTDNPERESLTVEVEIADGEFRGYYTQSSRDNEPVRYGKMFVSYADDQYNSVGRFKGFVTALEKDNRFKWDGVNEMAFVGKHIGVVFGEREYRGSDGAVHTSVNPRYPISLDRLAKGDWSEPKKKTLSGNTQMPPVQENNGFIPQNNEPLPF